ncbi:MULTISPECIES: endolytic transglycosylase MltG [unclassified Gilliamella]|uniref:endolytic transglycosylase MltG n=1 Tax=unclassified Gilliamella TaxID=2685620 RepID=UPI00132C3776|nr:MULTISPECIES: endolytic transglycosylase MltG [unclassified Gilliamella]MWN32668.1 endolytic transglycosylase MltG [Gilliamella sp. Pra-s60]MWP30117.1 endolytic transglycosylase MltG [Gilliamella sp. Pra-s54]MWP46080.1 endolytic transglycosylase MltG [Gilliamella sp. Pas-s27]
MIKKIFLYTLLTLILIVGGSISIGYYFLQQFSKQQMQVTNENQMFVLKKGTSMHQLVEQVKESQLLERAYLLPYLCKLNPSLRSIKAGTYQLHPHMTVEEFLQLLVSGKESNFSIQFVEGKRAKDWLTVIQNTPYIQQTLIGKTDEEIAKLLGIEGSIEGWLSPDTYLYTADTLDINILKRAHMTMKSNLQKIWDNRDSNLPYQSPYELLIIASIIEKETGINSERANVASVFVNRLKSKMKLQTDPTIIYGLGDNYKGTIRRVDLTDTQNPYNTYVIEGLPPTPIAMPSLASLEAAAHPAKTNYLFFVANGTGGHTFSTTYSNHQQAVNVYRQLSNSGN